MAIEGSPFMAQPDRQEDLLPVPKCTALTPESVKILGQQDGTARCRLIGRVTDNEGGAPYG